MWIRPAEGYTDIVWFNLLQLGQGPPLGRAGCEVREMRGERRRKKGEPAVSTRLTAPLLLISVNDPIWSLVYTQTSCTAGCHWWSFEPSHDSNHVDVQIVDSTVIRAHRSRADSPEIRDFTWIDNFTNPWKAVIR